MADAERMPIAVIAAVITATAALLGSLVTGRVLPTLNKRISFHLELLQHAPSDELRGLLKEEVAAVVKRDRRSLERGARFYVIQGLLWTTIACAIYLLIILVAAFVVSIEEQGVPVADSAHVWLPLSLIVACFGGAVFLLRREPRLASPDTAAKPDETGPA